jgi:hypothetical protein
MDLYSLTVMILEISLVIVFLYSMYRIWFGTATERRREELRKKLREIHGELNTVELERMVSEEEAKLNAKRSSTK